MSKSVDYARKATVTWDVFLHLVHTEKNFDYKQAWWYRAGKALEIEANAGKPSPSPSPLPPPRPPPVVSDTWAKSWVLMAQDPEKALLYQPHWGIAFTADAAYPQPTPQTLAALRGRGQRVRSWCDCLTTPPAVAKQMAKDLNLDGWIGQGENATEFHNALGAGCDLAVVNLSALSLEQRQVVGAGRKIKVAVELYRNANPGQQPDWMNLNEGVVGNCIAVYAEPGRPEMTFPQYVSQGYFNPHSDWIYDPGMQDEWRRMA